MAEFTLPLLSLPILDTPFLDLDAKFPLLDPIGSNRAELQRKLPRSDGKATPHAVRLYSCSLAFFQLDMDISVGDFILLQVDAPQQIKKAWFKSWFHCWLAVGFRHYYLIF